MHELSKSWADCFNANKSLIHVDISNNGIQWPEMEVIGEGLRTNHTLLGIHVNGNDAHVDS